MELATVQQGLPRFKATVKFYIDNELKVYENSSVAALGLMSAAKLNLAEMKTETLTLTTAHLSQFVAHALFNSKSILTDVLKQ